MSFVWLLCAAIMPLRWARRWLFSAKTYRGRNTGGTESMRHLLPRHYEMFCSIAFSRYLRLPPTFVRPRKILRPSLPLFFPPCSPRPATTGLVGWAAQAVTYSLLWARKYSSYACSVTWIISFKNIPHLDKFWGNYNGRGKVPAKFKKTLRALNVN